MTVLCHLTTTKPAPAPPRTGASSARRPPKRPAHTVTIEAVYCPNPDGLAVQFWGRTHDNLAQSVFINDAALLADASYAHDAQRLGTAPRLPLPSPTIGAPTTAPPRLDVTFMNAKFKSSLATLDQRLPTNTTQFFQTGLLLCPQKVPKRALPLYRQGLETVSRLLLAETPPASHWKLLLLYDALILAPYQSSKSFADVIRSRCALFLSGDWDPLFAGLAFRDPSHVPTASPTSADPLDALANRAQRVLNRTRSITGASAALRAPVNPARPTPGKLTKTFADLNPQIGAPAPPIPHYSPPSDYDRPSQGGGDSEAHH